MNISPRPKFFYVSPWLLAAATALLVLIVVTFTLNNIRREQQLMTGSMLQKAGTLIRIIHSGSRSAYFSDLRKGGWKTDSWEEYVQRVINHVAEDPEVMFLAVVNESSKAIAHNDLKKIGQNLDFILPKKSTGSKGKQPLVGYRIASVKDKGRVFEAVRQFYPYRPFLKSIHHNDPHRIQGRDQLGRRGMMLSKMLEDRALESLDGRSFYVLVGLDMSSYDKSLRRIKLQALILSLIMLLVGLGGWLSLAAVQGYRVSQRTLGEMKLFTSLLLAKLPVGIIATNRKGFITTFNESAEEMTGIERGYALGKKTGAILPKAFADFFSDSDSADSTTGQSAAREKEIVVMAESRKKHYLCHMIAVEGSQSDQQGWVLLVSDLTQLKDLEREMRENERLAAVGRMAAGVAHEVRNPLSSIKGLALLLKGRFAENSSDSEAAGLLIEQVERMNRTVSELLSFARPAPLNLQKISPKDLLDDTLRLIETDASNNGITTRLEVAPDLLDVAADRDRLNQVFINLLLNGVQAMEHGGELTVTAENSAHGKTVVIKVHDNGCGIPTENIPQLFYPYFTTKTGGTGIGLAISQKIVSDHKGTIMIDSAEGKETTVTVELPVFTEVSE
jgi:two-component system sensor histidine kinase HydH